MTRTKISRADEVAEGQTVKFDFMRDGRPVEGFLTRVQGQLVAYENRCRHLPLSLDFHDGRFFSRDGKYFICHNHNALYEPLTGLCIQGPCEGESLTRIEIDLVDGEVWMK